MGRADVGRDKEAVTGGVAARRAWRRANSSCRSGSSKSGSSAAKTRSAKFDMVRGEGFFGGGLVRLLRCVFLLVRESLGGVCFEGCGLRQKWVLDVIKVLFGRLRVYNIYFVFFVLGFLPWDQQK